MSYESVGMICHVLIFPVLNSVVRPTALSCMCDCDCDCVCDCVCVSCVVCDCARVVCVVCDCVCVVCVCSRIVVRRKNTSYDQSHEEYTWIDMHSKSVDGRVIEMTNKKMSRHEIDGVN